MTITIRTIDGQTIKIEGETEVHAILLLLEIGKSDVIKVKQGKMMHWIYKAHIASVTIWEG